MSRRLTPYLFAGFLGVVSGIYVFRPLLEETIATREIRGAIGTVKSTGGPQPDAAPQEGK